MGESTVPELCRLRRNATAAGRSGDESAAMTRRRPIEPLQVLRDPKGSHFASAHLEHPSQSGIALAIERWRETSEAFLDAAVAVQNEIEATLGRLEAARDGELESWTVGELAEQLKVSQSTVRGWIKRKERPLPALNEGVTRIFRAAFWDWVEGNAQVLASDEGGLPATSCSLCGQHWYQGVESECIQGWKCPLRKKAIKDEKELAKNQEGSNL